MQSSKSSLEQLSTALENVDGAGNVIAPISGTLVTMNAVEGSFTSNALPVAVIDGADLSALTLSESAVIAGITQNPTRYNPITNPENNAKRRETVLKYMTEQGYITQEQQDEALADPVYDRIQATDSSSKEILFIPIMRMPLLNRC